MEALNRFLRYVSIDTQSNPNSNTAPSSSNQFELAKLLVKELKELGVEKVELSDECVVYAWLDANVEGVDPIGLIAHMDTASDASGKNVKPSVIHFTGEDIVLNKELNIVLSKNDFPFMENVIGKYLVVTDGTTLLGADDKAGIAAIMELVSYLVKNPSIKHGKICIAFTPDEEVGRGVENFDIEKFGAKFAFTMDGGNPRDAEYETFNAASANVYIEGRSVHPGSAKDLMINASLVAIEFNELLNNEEIPSKTEKYQGFHHLIGIQGQCENATLSYILRNHDYELLTKKKEEFLKVKDTLNSKYGHELVKVEIKDSYRNMASEIQKHPKILELAYDAISLVGLNPISSPVRGGTDGSNLSLRGLPCPNLGPGGYNFHGRFEFLCVEEFYLSIEILKNIITLLTDRKVIIDEL